MKATKEQWAKVDSAAEASIVRSLETADSVLLYIPAIVRQLRHLGVAEVKRALLSLCRKGVICTHMHDYPASLTVQERQHCLRSKDGLGRVEYQHVVGLV